jgi:hypothetical protein
MPFNAHETSHEIPTETGLSLVSISQVYELQSKQELIFDGRSPFGGIVKTPLKTMFVCFEKI